MAFILFNLAIFVFILFLLFIISMLWPPDSPWAPFWTTPPSVTRVMCRLANVSKKTIVYDLGCGTGSSIVVAAREFGAPCAGIEIDPIRFMVAKWNVWRSGVNDQVSLACDNFFNINLSEADVFFIYLIPNALKRLAPKFFKEVKKGAVFASYVYPMPVDLFGKRLKLIKHDKNNRVFIYKMN